MRPTTALAAAAIIALSASACSSSSTTTAARARPTAVPDTAAAAKTAAGNFLALYSAGQWGDTWRLLDAADQKAVPESLWAAFHRGCRPATEGMAFTVTAATMTGENAVVTYTVPALKKIGPQTNAMAWTSRGWRIVLSARSVAAYEHGSLKKDLAAARKAGGCA